MDPQVFRFFLAGLLLKSYNRSNVHEKDAENYAIHHQNRRFFSPCRLSEDGRLGTEKIGKLMLELALPSVLAQIVNVLYNIVDRIYRADSDVGSFSAYRCRRSISIHHHLRIRRICKRRRRPLLQSHFDRN